MVHFRELNWCWLAAAKKGNRQGETHGGILFFVMIRVKFSTEPTIYSTRQYLLMGDSCKSMKLAAAKK